MGNVRLQFDGPKVWRQTFKTRSIEIQRGECKWESSCFNGSSMPKNFVDQGEWNLTSTSCDGFINANAQCFDCSKWNLLIHSIWKWCQPPNHKSWHFRPTWVECSARRIPIATIRSLESMFEYKYSAIEHTVQRSPNYLKADQNASLSDNQFQNCNFKMCQRRMGIAHSPPTNGSVDGNSPKNSTTIRLNHYRELRREKRCHKTIKNYGPICPGRRV